MSRIFKSPSPIPTDQHTSNPDFFDFGTPSAKDLCLGKENRKGCGRFPILSEEAREGRRSPILQSGAGGGTVGGSDLRQQQKARMKKRKSRSPDTVSSGGSADTDTDQMIKISDCSQHSSQSNRPATLPQPVPRHNLRDQLINAGFPITRQSTSFFGGNANNPFYGHNKQYQQQHDQHQQQQQVAQQCSSPNFPATNTVTSRVRQFEQQEVGVSRWKLL